MFAGQMKESMQYGELNKTITINILNFRYLHQLKDFHSTFHLYDAKHQYRLTDAMEIHFIELPKLLVAWRNGEVNPKKDRLVRWLLLLEASEDERITEILEEIAMQEDKELKKAMNEWERVSQDEAVRLAYEARRKSMLDERSAIKRAESLGLEKGRDDAKIEVALKMIEEGMEDDLICRVTSLPISRIQELRKQ
jgi:predicted transposase/invertase (TIGR01784 family)